MSLSDKKITRREVIENYFDSNWFLENDVKEFIKKLKLGLHNIILDCSLVEEIIDKLAGKELTKWKPQKKLETD